MMALSAGRAVWRNTDNVEVAGTHVGLPWNPAVLAAIAERLARYDSEETNDGTEARPLPALQGQ